MKQFKNVTVEIVNDESPMNPRDEFDNIATFYGPSNTRYLIGGKNDVEVSRYEIDSLMGEFERAGAVVYEFTTDAGNCFSVIEADVIRKEYSCKRISAKTRAIAESVAKGESETWQAYCNGEVYGYQVKNLSGEIIDSCYGYYGLEYAKQEAESSAEWQDLNIEAEAQENIKRAL